MSFSQHFTTPKTAPFVVWSAFLPGKFHRSRPLNIWASPFRSSSWSRWTSPTMVFFSSFRSRRLASRWLVVGDLAATGCAIFHLDRLFFSASPEVALGNALQCQPLPAGIFQIRLCYTRKLPSRKASQPCHFWGFRSLDAVLPIPHSAWRWNPPEMPACPSTWRDQLLKPRCV